jgi:hypothetical protein
MFLYMNLMRKLFSVCTLLAVLLVPVQVMAEEKKQEKETGIKIPGSAVNISKENTYPNATQDLPYLQPSQLTEKLFSTSDVKIENPSLIKIMNESQISPTKLALGYRAKIYLGQWPLNYESKETSVNWEYKQVNINSIDNRGGNNIQQIRYLQEEERNVAGGLTAKIPKSNDVKKMMMIEAGENTKLPLAFRTVIGKGTKKQNVYNVPQKKVGNLYSYIPAVNEKGRVTYGEVYIVLKGSKMSIEVKNVTHQGIGAWIPVQDYLTFQFNTTN